ncbi:DUF4911 domain-containing protein [bacterium]|nr:DUF4911 domain-containing protein [bacterium]
MNQECIPIYLKVRTEDIVYIKSVVEAHEGLGIVRTLNPDRGELVLLVIKDQQVEAMSLISELKTKVELHFIDKPESVRNDWLINSEE